MKRIFLVFILFSAFIVSLSAQDKPANPKALELFIEGKTYELQDNYIAAISRYEDALKIEKASGIYYTLSKLYNNVSQYQKALDNGLTALKMDPDNVDYQENVADCYIVFNDYKNALVYLKSVSEKKPYDINILYNVGRVYEALKQPSEAIKIYERITDNFQYDETVLTRMIEIYENYKDYANVAATIEKLLSLNPTDIQLKYSAAAAYLKIPDYDNALKIYEEILRTNPQNKEIQTETIKIYFRQHRNNEAFERYGRMIDRDTVDFETKISIAAAFLEASKDDADAIGVAKSILTTLKNNYPNEWLPDYYLAVIDVRENNSGLAEQKMKDVLVRADTSTEAYIQVGFFYYEQNRFPEALDVFKSGIVKFPNDFRLNYLAGNTIYRAGKNKDALPYLEKAYQINPADENVISNLGIIYDNLNMDSECEKVYDEALKIFPDNILMLNNYAYHLSERGIRLDEAEKMSRKTITKEPNNSSYLDTYGWVLYKMKDYKNARIYIEKAIKIGSNAVLYEHLGDVYEGLGEIVSALKYWNEGLKLDPGNKDLLYKIEKYK
jgi:tetratricopeptide (TPR) repeat protein